MQLSQKQKIICIFFFFFLLFLNSDSIFNIFKERMTLIADVFLNLRNTLLDKCLKSPLSEDPITTNMVNGPKHCSMLNEGDFGKLLIHVMGIHVENVTLIDMQNLRTVC